MSQHTTLRQTKWAPLCKCTFLVKTFYILINVSLKFAPRGSTDHDSALVVVLDWHQTGNKPLPEPLMIQVTDTYKLLLGADSI